MVFQTNVYQIIMLLMALAYKNVLLSPIKIKQIIIAQI